MPSPRLIVTADVKGHLRILAWGAAVSTGWRSDGGSRPEQYGTRVPQLPRLTGRELLSALHGLGWEVVAQRGSHAQLKHPDRGGRVTVPLHAGETLGPGLVRSILAQARVTVDELRSAL